MICWNRLLLSDKPHGEIVALDRFFICVEQKAFNCLCFLFSFFLRCFCTDWEKGFVHVSYFGTQTRVPRIGLISLDTLANIFVSIPFVVRFHVCEHSIPYALEINSNGRFKREDVESCFSTTKNIFSLPQFLCLPNLTGWQLTMKGSHP